MSASAQEMKAFLEKRGLKAEVEKLGETYYISVSSNSVNEIAQLLATIREPGRFIVSVQIADIVDIVANDSGLLDKIAELKTNIILLEELMTRNITNLDNTDTKLKEQSTESISGLKTIVQNLGSSVNLTIKEEVSKLSQMIELLEQRVAELEKKPWWKKW